MRPAEYIDPEPGAREAEVLRRYWDDLDRGASDQPADIDPALAATVRRLRTLHGGNAPAAARNRVWKQLQDGAAPPATYADLVVTPAPSNGHHSGTRYVPSPASTPPKRRRWWPAVELVAATLLVAALGLGFRAFWPDGNSQTGSIPGVSVTVAPSPSTLAPATTATKLVTVGLSQQEIPRGVAASVLTDASIPPGERTTWTAPQGPRLLVPLSGRITVRTAGPIKVQRSGQDGAWDVFESGTTIDLDPGDAVLLLGAESVGIDNLGTAPAELLAWSLIPGDSTDSHIPASWIVHVQDAKAETITLATNTLPVLRLRRFELAPAAHQAMPSSDVTRLAVARGINTAGTPEAAQIDRSDDNLLVNSGTAPVTVYVVTI
jgi:hypothetical protein